MNPKPCHTELFESYPIQCEVPIKFNAPHLFFAVGEAVGAPAAEGAADAEGGEGAGAGGGGGEGAERNSTSSEVAQADP